MADKGSVSGFNGVSYGVILTADAQDGTDGFVEVDFGDDKQYPYAYSITVLDGSGAIVDASGAVITQSVNGKIRIEDGGSFAVTDGYVFHIVASPAREV